jgi:fructokinase
MIVVVGEALVDVFISPEGGVTHTPGGSPLNVAVGLARLGETTGLVTRLGADADGDLVREHLESSGVQLLGEHHADRTGVAAARLSASGDAGYEFAVAWDLPPTALPDQADALHFGSLGALLAPGCDQVTALAEQAAESHLPVSYDPNVRPAVSPDAEAAWVAVRHHAALADLVRLSEEDAAFLRPEEAPERVAAELLECGTRVVVVTSGEGMTLAASPAGRVSLAAPSTTVADTVGAGDSFMAALVAATLPERRRDPQAWSPDRDELERHVRAAHAAAAITVTRPGADPPWRRELPDGWPDL